MCWLGWQTAHSFHWHWKQKEKKKTGFLEVAPLLLSTICTISGAVCLECGDKQMTFSQFTSLSYHTLVQRHSMCRLSGRWQNERLAVRSRGRNGKWCVPPSDGTNPPWIHGWALEACGIPPLSGNTGTHILFTHTCCVIFLFYNRLLGRPNLDVKRI